MSEKSTNDNSGGYQFGAFKGVFTPSILTIFGVIMYLRSGWMLGNVGLIPSLVIVTMACGITFLTALALSALVTNMEVKTGGAYFLVSRSLGLEAGAAIGVPLYLAQAVSIAFYVIGFAEAFVGAFPVLPVKEVALVALAVSTLLAYLSADLALRTQFIILILIVASLFSFFIGHPVTEPLPADVEVPPLVPFWIVFAVYFPAATGILSGVSMSGDLKNPARAIPVGTLAAVGLSYVVYLAIPFYLDHSVHDPNVLRVNNLIMKDVARWGWLILAGVWAASLSSALGSILAAPRTLQALASDRVLPRWMGKGYGRGNDPRIATLISFALAFGCVMLGNLNIIAPILTMFFLTTYGTLCLAAGLEEMLGGASWRPKVRVHAGVNLLGAAACFGFMFMIHALAAWVSLAVVTGIYIVMKKRQLSVQWGDIRHGVLMLIARGVLRRLSEKKTTARSWQPNILVLSGSPTSRWYLIEMANDLALGSGCLTVATILPLKSWTADKVESVQQSIRKFLESRQVTALVKVLPEDDLETGASALIKAYGFGPISPNTILLGETEKYENYLMFAGLIRLVSQTRRNLVMVREGKQAYSEDNQIIHLWWRGENQNIGLMITLAYLLARHGDRNKPSLVLKTIVESAADVEKAKKRLTEFVKAQRLTAEVDVIEKQGRESFAIIHDASHDAGLVIMGLLAPTPEISDEDYSAYYARLIQHTGDMPPTAFIMAAENVDFGSLYGR